MSMTAPERFRKDGFLPQLRIHSAAEAAAIRREFDALEAVEGRERCEIGLKDRHFDQGFVWEVATHPGILDAVAGILGPDVMVLATHFFCKYPAAGAEAAAPFVAWHQDVTYWGLEPPLALTAWYAVDDSDVENGCMRVIPGTHSAGIRTHGSSERPGNLLSINQEVPVSTGEERSAVDLPLSAGEISLHDGLLIHGSNPNRSGRRRCGMTVRYIPPHVRQKEPNSFNRVWEPVLVRGIDRHRHYGDRPPPYPLPGYE